MNWNESFLFNFITRVTPGFCGDIVDGLSALAFLNSYESTAGGRPILSSISRRQEAHFASHHCLFVLESGAATAYSLLVMFDYGLSVECVFLRLTD